MGRAARKPPSYVTGTQQLKPEYWPGWDVAMILRGDPEEIGREMIRRHEAAGGTVTGFWIVKHDRDCLADGTPKEVHLHWVLQQGGEGQLREGKLQATEIDRAFGWSKSISRAPGRGARIENAQSYLVHAKDADKFQYSPADVVTLRGQDYAEIEESYRDAWARRAVVGRQKMPTAREWAELGDALVQQVLDGLVDEEAILLDKTLTDVYTRNQAKVDLALQVRFKREMKQEVAALRAGQFQKTVLWVTGGSDQGKTYAVESIAAELVRRLGWRVYRAAARNGLDDYAGEQIVLISDPSTSILGWPDLLQFLDPRHSGPISALYRNRGDAAPRVVLISVVTDPVEFGFFVPGKRSTNDSLDQLVRRLSLVAHAEKVDEIPRYSVGPVALLPAPERRAISVPKEGAAWVEIGYGLDPETTVVGLSCEEVVGVVIGEVAARSPDVNLVVEDAETLVGRIIDGAPTEALDRQIEAHLAAQEDQQRRADLALEHLAVGDREKAEKCFDPALDHDYDTWGPWPGPLGPGIALPDPQPTC